MDKKKIIAILLFFITITMMFFSYKVVITHDSSHYLWLTNMLTKNGNFSDWDVARGIVFPLFIRICHIFFGKSVSGLLVGMFAFYIAMLIFCYLIYKDTIKNEEFFSKKIKYPLLILFFILVVINPMVIGFYHTLLTEFIAVTFGVMGCYLAWKWMYIDFTQSKVKYIIYTLIIGILCAIAWQLKQPYVSTILFPTVIAAVISLARKFNLKNLIQKLATITVCGICIITSMKIWNVVLNIKNVKVNEGRTSMGFFASSILWGLRDYELKDTDGYYTINRIQQCEKLLPEDKEKIIEILNNNSEYKHYVIVNSNKEYYEVIYNKGETVSTQEAAKFWLKTFKENPSMVLGGYVYNYLSTISVYNIPVDTINTSKVDRKIDFVYTDEIEKIGFKTYNYGSSLVFYIEEPFNNYVGDYLEVNRPIVAFNWIEKNLQKPTTFIMKISYLLLPVLTICSIIAVFRTKRRYTDKYNKIIDMITILYSFSFLHILMHSLLGATIDRYTIPALVTTFIAILLSAYAIIYRKKYKIICITKGENKKQ